MPNTYGKLIRDGVNYSHDTADSISYNNNTSGLTSTNTQDAIDEIKTVIPTALSDLSDDSTHRIVTDTEKTTWNNKSDLTLGTTSSTAAAGNHTHNITLATDTGTSTISLTANTKYKLTAGGKSIIFTTPKDNNTTYTAGDNVSINSSNVISATDTTYTFTGGTNKITVTPSGGTATDVTITPSISNNITGSGTRTNGYLAKFSGTNTVTNGPQLGSDTTTFLRNDGSWATPTGNVSGVKGNVESSYRTGNVNITPANIGALALTGGTLTGDVTFSKSSAKTTSSDPDSPAQINLTTKWTDQTAATPTEIVSSGSIKAYSDHAGYGTSMVIVPGGCLFIGSGESPSGHYNLYKNGTGEKTFITSDNEIHIQSNANTLTNRKGVLLTTGGDLVPDVADVATNNAGGIGTSDYKWANGYFTNINGVAVGDSPKFTDTNTKVTSTANHYAPASASGGDISASATGGTAAWSIDVVQGVTLNTDGKGHVTGMTVTSGKIPANPNTDVNVKVNNTNPTSGTWYYPTWYTATSGTGNLNSNNGLRYYSLEGTSAAGGRTVLSIGNSTQTGTAGNKYGEIWIYSEKQGYAALKMTAGATTGRTITFPDKTGTVALTDDCITIGTTSSTAAAGNHTHSTTIAADSGTSSLSMSANTKYKITAGGTSYIFTTPKDTTYSAATTAAAGLMSAADKIKLNGIATGAEVNQNAFSNIVVGTTTVAADTETDSVTFAASGILTVTADATNDKITFGVATGTTSATAAKGNHTHTLTLATDTGTSTVSMTANTKYKLTAGGSSVIFTTPPNASDDYVSKTNGGTFQNNVSIIKSNSTTASVDSYVILGNTTASGTSGCSRGVLRICGDGAYYHNIYSNTTPTANRSIYLPNATGTIALTSHTHTTTIAADSGESSLNLSANTVYKLTTGGTEFIFKTPADTNNKVSMTNCTTDAFYNLLFSTTQYATTTKTEGTQKSNNLIFNPSLSKIWLNESGVASIQAGIHQFLTLAASNEPKQRAFLGVLDSMWGLGPETHGMINSATSNHRWATVYANSGTINTSDRRIKKDIVSLDNKAKEFIMDLDPVSFKFIDGTSNRTHFGLIAQDVEDTMTKLNMTALDFAGLCKDQKYEDYRVPILNENGEEILDIDGTVATELKQRKVEGDYLYSLRYEEFISPLIKTVQLQEEKINSLEDKIDKLEKLVEQLTNK